MVVFCAGMSGGNERLHGFYRVLFCPEQFTIVIAGMGKGEPNPSPSLKGRGIASNVLYACARVALSPSSIPYCLPACHRLSACATTSSASRTACGAHAMRHPPIATIQHPMIHRLPIMLQRYNKKTRYAKKTQKNLHMCNFCCTFVAHFVRNTLFNKNIS